MINKVSLLTFSGNKDYHSHASGSAQIIKKDSYSFKSKSPVPIEEGIRLMTQAINSGNRSFKVHILPPEEMRTLDKLTLELRPLPGKRLGIAVTHKSRISGDGEFPLLISSNKVDLSNGLSKEGLLDRLNSHYKEMLESPEILD